MDFAVHVFEFVKRLPDTRETRLLVGQLLRCGTSVGANYRAACRARSRAEFISKMGIVEEECDEALYWMELLVGSGIVKGADLSRLVKEAREILALVVSSIRTARSRNQVL